MSDLSIDELRMRAATCASDATRVRPPPAATPLGALLAIAALDLRRRERAKGLGQREREGWWGGQRQRKSETGG